jgi:excinuclease ABC subunit B
MEGARAVGRGSRKRHGERAARRLVAPDQIAAEIDRLEKAMYRHARELEFEEAAKLRDEIDLLRSDLLEKPTISAN